MAYILQILVQLPSAGHTRAGSRTTTPSRKQYMDFSRALIATSMLAATLTTAYAQTTDDGALRPRARDIGLVTGILPTGKLNAITDVAGVRVGQTSLIKGDNIRTGVTAILPHAGNMFQEKVPAAVYVGNGFGKLIGTTQIKELGEIESPILLTGTLNVPRVTDAGMDWMLALPGNEQVRSINMVVGETNDGYLNDIRGRHVGRDEVFAALRNASEGPVQEGVVGAGVGTQAFGFKGGIGTASRVVPESAGGYTVGVLVQTNFGGVLTMNGAPVGQELGRYFLKEELERQKASKQSAAEHHAQDKLARADTGAIDLDKVSDKADGSIMIIVATDAPLSPRNLERVAKRAMMGLARTGSPATNGSGDYVIAFSTAEQVRVRASEALRTVPVLGNSAVSPLFLATVEATEEAIYNSLLRATTTQGIDGHVVDALPIDDTIKILKKFNALKPLLVPTQN